MVPEVRKHLIRGRVGQVLPRKANSKAASRINCRFSMWCHEEMLPSSISHSVLYYELGIRHWAEKFDHNNKRTNLTKDVLVPFVLAKELFKRITTLLYFYQLTNLSTIIQVVMVWNNKVHVFQQESNRGFKKVMRRARSGANEDL